jgi:glycerophosphoryl diester phosphodiesterase
MESTSNNTIISFFHQKSLIEINLVNEKIPTGFLTVNLRLNIKSIKKKLERDFIHRYYEFIQMKKIPIPQMFRKQLINHYTEKIIKEARSHGISINPWTVNSTEYLIKALKLGVFGIITDNVEKAQSMQKNALLKKSERIDR